MSRSPKSKPPTLQKSSIYNTLVRNHRETPQPKHSTRKTYQYSITTKLEDSATETSGMINILAIQHSQHTNITQLRPTSTELPAALRKTLAVYPWLEPGCLLADRGYDSLPNHRLLAGLDIIPVIHIRKPTAADGLYDGVYTAEGKPACMGGEPMEYLRTDPETGAHLFRCQAGGCPLKTERTKAVPHCDSEVWEAADANLRVLGPLPRFTEAWKRLYRQRMSIERIYRSLKHSRGLEGHCVRGLRKIRLHATLSALTYQATALARLKAKDFDGMRRMTVKVA